MGSFSKLRILDINGCNKLTNLFSFSFAKCLVQLRELKVVDCSNMKALIAEGGEDANYNNEEIQFPQLSSLTLWDLPCLRSIYYPKKVCLETQMARSTTEDVLFNEMVSFPNLTSLYISECKSLKYICKVSTLKSLLQLKQLQIYHCEMVEEIILTEKFEESMDKIVFPNLNSLQLSGLSSCIRFSNGYSIEFQSLERMLLSSCPALKNFVSNVSNTDVVNIDTFEDIQFLFNEMVAFPNLQSLYMEYMDSLENIWHTQLPPHSFSKLRSLAIWGCNALDQHVFPASMACGLLQKLEKIQIVYCGGLKHIVGKGKSEEEPYSFHFPHLTILRLEGLYRLRSFYEGRHDFNCPKLEDLEIYDCPKANKVLKDCYRAKTEEHHIVPILSFDKANPNLKTLKLDCQILKAMQISIEQCSILKEIVLRAVRYRYRDFLSAFLKRLCNLEKLVISYSSLEELFLLDASTAIPKCLELQSIDNLKHIWKEDSQVPFTSNLQTLRVRFCHCLKSISPSATSFQNLTTLNVDYCRDLENLVTASAAKSMVCLVELRIKNCDMMKEIVANDGDHAEHHIIFNQLKSLELSELAALNSFCSGNYTFNFPLLEQVTVHECWQMKIFCGGVFTTPKLQGIRHQKYRKELYWQGNVNATLASRLTEKDVLRNATRWHVIKDSTSQKVLLANQLLFLHNLRVINVKGCDSIQVVFDLEEVFVEDRHAGLLPGLGELKLINLPMLSQFWNKDPFGILDFKKLRLLEVQNCSILKHAFTPSMASSLVALREIIVENCEMMEAIIKEEEAEERVESANKLILPSLESVHLKCLPKLSSLYSGNGILECPSLEKIYIKECPSMKEFVSSLSSIESPTTDDRMAHQIAIPPLEEMSIEWELIKDKLEGNNQPELLHRLKVFELIGFEGESAAFPSTKSFPNIEKLGLSDSLVEKIIIQEVNKGEESVPRLRKVKLLNLPNLKQLVDVDDPKMVIQNLEELEVWECSRLEIVVPSLLSFKNLTYLEVSKCDGLINLIAASTAKSLVHLRTMNVRECKMMREIIAIESDGKEDYQICFSRLEILELVDLPCLTSFCSANYAFDFPCLKKVLIEDCPNMKMFAQQVLNTPQLTKVFTGPETRPEWDWAWEWEGGLNNTIESMFVERNEE